MSFYSPLRYPGGKGNIVGYFKQIIKDNFLLDGIYIEPYAGGASVALSLLLDGYVSRIIINDIDRSLFAFWHSVLNETDALCELIKKTPVTIAVWKKQKEKQRSKDTCSLLELGFSTFFLNRTNYSGILSAGVIGGLKQNTKWKINARYNKKELIKRIRNIAAYRNRIELHNLDAMELIKSIRKNPMKKTLIYFDPPYYVKGKDLYLNHYADDDHKEIFEEIDKLGALYWIVTYDHVKPIKKLYRTYRQKKYGLRYSAGKPEIGKELMIFSNNLHITNNPTLL